MTIRQIWKNLTRERRVKKAIRKIKTDHVKEQSKAYSDAEFGKKYNIVIGVCKLTPIQNRIMNILRATESEVKK